MRLVVEVRAQLARPSQRPLVVVDPEEQEEAVAGNRGVGAEQRGMVLDAPLVQAEQHRAIRVEELPEVWMGRTRRRLAEQRLVPPEAPRHVAHPDDRPRAFHGIQGLTV